MQIRQATEGDAAALSDVFFRAVREGPSPYSAAQRAAWVPEPPAAARFAERLARKFVVLSGDAGAVTGFMTLEAGGYIDLAFILPAARGCGTFGALYAAVEAEARVWEEARLWTHASLMAQPAFAARGFVVMHHETVERAGQSLACARMEKHLT